MLTTKRRIDPKTGEVTYVVSDGKDLIEMPEIEYRRFMAMKHTAIYQYQFLAQSIKSEPRRRSKPALRGLIRVADLFGLQTRKQIKAMAGDFQAEITRLRRARRPMYARWNAVLAWGYAIYFVLRAPVDKLLSIVRRSMLG